MSPIPCRTSVRSTANGESEIVNPGAGTSQANPSSDPVPLTGAPRSRVSSSTAEEAPPEPARARIAVDKVTSQWRGHLPGQGRPSGRAGQDGDCHHHHSPELSPERAVELLRGAPAGTFTIKETLPARVSDDLAWRMQRTQLRQRVREHEDQDQQDLPRQGRGRRSGHLRDPEHAAGPDQHPQDHQGRVRDVQLRDPA